MYRYSVYGLALTANIEIDGLVEVPSAGEPDCILRSAPLPPLDFSEQRSITGADDPVRVFTTASENPDYLFEYADGNRFAITDGGREIFATWPATSTPQDMATYLLGPVLAFVLRLRGVLSFHGSSIVIGNHAVAVVGPSGSGKSTTAAAFVRRGHRVLTEDVVPIVMRDDAPHVLTGYGRVRLWPDSTAALYGDEDALPLLTPTWQKRYVDLHAWQQFESEPQPLGAIVLLRERGEEPRIEQVLGHTAVIDLIANTSMALYLDNAARMRELEQIAALIEKVPVFALYPSRSTADVDRVCDLIAGAVAPAAMMSR